MLGKAFKFFDADSSGKISQDNLKEVLGFCSMEMITQVDRDGDNQIDFSEFKKMMSP
jgi:Ca2+-binding EF-hand superfamily protein